MKETEQMFYLYIRRDRRLVYAGFVLTKWKYKELGNIQENSKINSLHDPSIESYRKLSRISIHAFLKEIYQFDK